MVEINLCSNVCVQFGLMLNLSHLGFISCCFLITFSWSSWRSIHTSIFCPSPQHFPAPSSSSPHLPASKLRALPSVSSPTGWYNIHNSVDTTAISHSSLPSFVNQILKLLHLGLQLTPNPKGAIHHFPDVNSQLLTILPTTSLLAANCSSTCWRFLVWWSEHHLKKQRSYSEVPKPDSLLPCCTLKSCTWKSGSVTRENPGTNVWTCLTSCKESRCNTQSGYTTTRWLVTVAPTPLPIPQHPPQHNLQKTSMTGWHPSRQMEPILIL